LFFLSSFSQNNQVLGIGSGSTIVHAVQRIGMFLDCLLDVLCVIMGVEVEEREGAGTGLTLACLGSSSADLGEEAACLRSAQCFQRRLGKRDFVGLLLTLGVHLFTLPIWGGGTALAEIPAEF
jgi:hypothetical protein